MEYLEFSGIVEFGRILCDTFIDFSKEDWRVIAASAVIILGIYGILRPFCKTRAARSWIITGANSVVMTGVGIYYLILYGIKWNTESHERVNEWLLSDEIISKYMTLFFVVYLASDLIVGILDYIDQITFWAGWFHHNFYMILSLWIIHRNSTVALIVLGPLELPTLVIALGQIKTSWNNSQLAGISFVLTRILLLGMFMIRYSYLPDIHALPPMLFIFCLHCMWLYSSLTAPSTSSKPTSKSE